MKKYIIKRKSGFPALILFLLGFLAGNLLPNFLWKSDYHQKTITSLYLINTFASRELSNAEYLKEILCIRGSYYILSTVCAFSIFGVPLAVAGILLLGLQTGALLSMSILEFGFSGGLVGISLLFPQYLIYIPTTLLLMSWVYEMSLNIWKNKTTFPAKTGKYVLNFFLAALAYAAGILLECCLNPWFVTWVLNLTKIF